MRERVEHLFVCDACASQRLISQQAQAPRVSLEPRCCGPMSLKMRRRIWEHGWSRVRLIINYGGNP